MKKFFAIIALAVVAAFGANNVNAQESKSCQEAGSWSIAPTVGYSASFLVDTDGRSEVRPGLTVGVETQYMQNNWLGWSAGVMYAQKGGAGNVYGVTTKYDVTVKLDYITMPVLANFYVCKGLALKCGLQPGFLVNSQISLKDSKNDISVQSSLKNEFYTFDMQAVLGVSYEYNNFIVDGRVLSSGMGTLKALDRFDDYNCGNVDFTIGVGYRF